VQLGRIPWSGGGVAEEAVLRARLEQEGFRVFTWRDAPGATYSAHSHDHDESLWVVEGEITFDAAGERLRLGPGDRLMLPRGTVHTARAGPRGATYLIGERAGRAR
jgi:quercetin dioxygenase-like cupin family protein